MSNPVVTTYTWDVDYAGNPTLQINIVGVTGVAATQATQQIALEAAIQTVLGPQVDITGTTDNYGQ